MLFLYLILTAYKLFTKFNKMKRRSGFSKSSKSTKSKIRKLEDPFDDFLNSISQSRIDVGPSIREFNFNKKRVRLLSRAKEISTTCESLMYWMSRDSRVEDNWALLFAQRVALKCEIPLHVCYCLANSQGFNIRHLRFLLKGLQEVERDCINFNIRFHLLHGEPPDVLPNFIKKYKVGGIVTDFMPLSTHLKWIDSLIEKLPSNIPFSQVDAHNIVPCWNASPKLEYAARTFRPKIIRKLSEFLTHFPPVIYHPYDSNIKQEKIDWEDTENMYVCDRSLNDSDWAIPGTTAGLHMLFEFCSNRLKDYSSKRNDPNQDSLSMLSPWFHFGHIAPQRAVLSVQNYKSKYSKSVEDFMEEAIVRRELSDNFCFYNKYYNSLKGAPKWAQNTLKDHIKDKRHYIYTKKQFENALTHDPLWNSAQIQAINEGKIHGYLRMYWAKKILEWTKTPEKALSIAIYLNDKYNLDGSDPNGFVGCLWSIAAIHDQAWKERPIFGKIRYMNFEGCKRKFDVYEFINKYSEIYGINTNSS